VVVIDRRVFTPAGRADEANWRIWREGIAMVLYLSIVLLVTLAAIPAAHGGVDGWIRGLTSLELIEILWGTTIGLALAHWFAFGVATQGVGAGHLKGHDLHEALAQLAGAAFVATIATVPVVLFEERVEQLLLPFVLALIIGCADYLVERVNGRSRARSAVFGAITLVVALTIATVKYILTPH
jgi:hypothetical protein